MWHKTCADPRRGCRTAGPRSGGCCVHVAFCSHAWLPWDSWHTTLLAEVGQNGEGPLPWVERDYTPISTWSEWERAPCRGCPTNGLRRPCRADALGPPVGAGGSCDILIKVYPDGKATSWLHSQPPGSQARHPTPPPPSTGRPCLPRPTHGILCISSCPPSPRVPSPPSRGASSGVAVVADEDSDRA